MSKGVVGPLWGMGNEKERGQACQVYAYVYVRGGEGMRYGVAVDVGLIGEVCHTGDD